MAAPGASGADPTPHREPHDPDRRGPRGFDPGDYPELDGLDLDTVFERSPAGMSLFDLRGRFLRVNPALCELLGRPAEELVGLPYTEIAPPTEPEDDARFLADTLRGERAVMARQTPFRRPDGTVVWLLVEGVLFPRPDGRTPRVGFAVYIDLTEVRRVEGELRRSTAQLDAVVSGSPVAIIMSDLDGTILVWNEAAERMYGWTAEERVGRPFPHLEQYLDEFKHMVRASAEPGGLQGFEVERRAKDGTPIHLAVWATVLRDADGRAWAVLSEQIDISERRRATELLRQSERRYRTLVENVTDTISVIDAEGRVTSSSAQSRPVLGYPTDSWDARSIFDLAHPDDLAQGLQLLEEVVAEPGQERSIVARARHADGHWEWIHVTAVNLLDDPAVQGIVLTTRNVTEARRAESLLASQAEVLELIAASAPIAETLTAVGRLVEDHTDGARTAPLLLRGGRLEAGGPTSVPDEVIAAIAQHRQPDGGPLVVPDALAGVLARHGIAGSWVTPVVPQEAGSPVGALATFLDADREPSTHEQRAALLGARLAAIALKRHENETQLAHLALHDELTGLPNRSLLLDRLEQALHRAQRAGGTVAVMFLDLDRFKVVNDSLGHPAGDELLQAFAERLAGEVDGEDTLGRFGGDEFVLLCTDLDEPRDALRMADRITGALREPFVLASGEEIFLTASVGLAFASGPDLGPAPAAAARGADTVLRDADAAMYRAKERGRNRLEIFDDAMRSMAVERLALDHDLRRGLERGEFVVHYQPVIDLADGRVTGMEALVRWQHPDRGLLLPDTFIPVAEDTGLVVQLGEWVLEQAVLDAQAMAATEPAAADLVLSVNVSARQLSAATLVPSVERVLDHHGFLASRLCLELTESDLLEDVDRALGVLELLAERGVSLALDDFGRGYSSLTHLQRFPVQVVKIDRAFVTGLDHNPQSAAIATAVVHMAHALGIRAQGEGIETERQLQRLKALGCDLGQGFLVSRAVDRAAFTELVATARWGA